MINNILVALYGSEPSKSVLPYIEVIAKGMFSVIADMDGVGSGESIEASA